MAVTCSALAPSAEPAAGDICDNEPVSDSFLSLDSDDDDEVTCEEPPAATNSAPVVGAESIELAAASSLLGSSERLVAAVEEGVVVLLSVVDGLGSAALVELLPLPVTDESAAGEMLPLIRLLPDGAGSPLLVSPLGLLLACALGFMNGILGLFVREAPNKLGL